jgi:hypothetical protein
MKHDAGKSEVLDDRQPDGRATATSWQFIIAYVLMILPAFYGGQNHPHPVPTDMAATFYVLIGIAIGTGLYVVRRQPGNVLGWIGLLGWGVLAIGASVNALLK